FIFNPILLMKTFFIRIIFLLLSLLFLSLISISQSRGIIWEKAVGGSGTEFGQFVLSSSDSTFLMIGWTFSDDGDIGGTLRATDIWLVNFDKTGNTLWKRKLGSSSYEYPYGAFKSSKGQFIIGGQAGSGNDFDVNGNHGQTDMWVLSINNDSTTKWARCYGGTKAESCSDIIETKDGGYVFVGTNYSNDVDASSNHGGTDILVIKVDTSGNVLWRNVLGGDSAERVTSITESPDGSLYVLGTKESKNNGNVTNNHGGTDLWVVKLNNSGVLQWEKSLGGSDRELPHKLKVLGDNNLLVLARTLSNDGDVTGNHGFEDAWVVKLNVNGSIVWQKAYGGSGYDILQDFAEDPDGSIVLSGSLTSDVWILKITSTGDIIWEKTYGGSGTDYASQIQRKRDHSGYYVLAETNSPNDGNVVGYHPSLTVDTVNGPSLDGWLLELDLSGNLRTQRCLGGRNRERLVDFIQ